MIERKLNKTPEFYKNLAKGQSPKVLFIGCSDSRVPVSVTGLDAGEVFVHRNIANVIPENDLNSSSVIQYAVEHLKVEYIIVCGHYNCGGVAASFENEDLGLMGAWIQNIKDVYKNNQSSIENLPPEKQKNALSELNVVNSVMNICKQHAVIEAWEKGQKLCVLGWVYELDKGAIRELGIRVDGLNQLNMSSKL